MRAVELFSGIGLSACGVVAAGLELVRAVEIRRRLVRVFNAQTVFNNLLPPVAQVGDVGAVKPVECDVVFAGPVCKAFSPGATVFGTKGAEDKRNTFPALFQFLQICRPPRLLVENSFGLVRHPYLPVILEHLAQLGYLLEVGEIDCYDYGVPQHRRRVVITGCLYRRWRLPPPTRKPSDPATVGDALRVPPPPGDPWPLLEPLSEDAVDYMTRSPVHFRKHRALTADAPAPTILASYKKGVPYGVVVLGSRLWRCRPRLAARLQGLPDEYALHPLTPTSALDGVGEGFPPPAVRALVSTMPD